MTYIGSGTDFKTMIHNFRAISLSLNRRPSYLAEYLKLNRRTRCIYDGAFGRAELNGCHTAEDVALAIQAFVEIFVTCPGCLSAASTELEYDSFSKKVVLSCLSCRVCCPVTDHKLTKFIENHIRDISMASSSADSNDTCTSDDSSFTMHKRVRFVLPEGCKVSIEEEGSCFKEPDNNRQFAHLKALGLPTHNALDIDDDTESQLAGWSLNEEDEEGEEAITDEEQSRQGLCGSKLSWWIMGKSEDPDEEDSEETEDDKCSKEGEDDDD
eukprot:CAMPEP_0184675646 /NCGR_PEP_ID=MMETSP0308-20130426/87902_1 /TAXON_ID=38269 /ORGANISM="Gloeochaete witrockiana, Strain SAG 46.84" /LENGTH=268 /DNA_ID=CAMNT_0027123367 /DNA_START=312 /DNA_END=1118 /DNA_ORIENTATION=-